MHKKKIIAIALLILLNLGLPSLASPTQVRLDKDIAAGKPVVIQLSVALADNKNQWIVFLYLRLSVMDRMPGQTFIGVHFTV